jgi:tetratricopeptide (TPR) repeat protein
MLRTLSALLGFVTLLAAASCDDGGSDGVAGAGGDAGQGGGGAPVDGARPEGVALCYSELSRGHAATKAFEAAISGGHAEDRLAVIAGLEAAREEHPTEEQFALLSGLAHLWRVAEPLPEEAGDLGVVASSATKAREALETAYELCPTDHRIPAWLGPILVNMGRAIGDEETVAQGMAVLQQGIDKYPSFVLFSKLLVYADLPATDPEFQMALAAFEANSDYCATGNPGDPACLNTPAAWHNLEGAWVFAGDVFAKAGRKADALGFYELAKTSPTYADWDYQALLDDRIDTIDARIASFADTDPTNDALSAWSADNQCSICHRQ